METRTLDEQRAAAALERGLRNYDRKSGGFFLEEFLGCRVSLQDDTCILTLEIEDFMFNSAGTLHGGVMAFLLDSVSGFLFKAKVGPGYTLESKVQFLRSPGRGAATCTARFLKRGRVVSFIEATLVGPDNKAAAVATATWHSA